MRYNKHDIINKTHLLQKRALRAIHNKKYNSHTDPLFKHSMILKVSDLHELEVLSFMHDYTNEKLPSSFDDIYRRNNEINSAYLTRQSNLYHVARTKSKSIDMLPLFNFPTTWNKWSHMLDVNFHAKNSYCNDCCYDNLSLNL